jgi:hypothetical protein
MKIARYLLIASSILLCFAWKAQAADVKVIANPSVSVSAVSSDDLKEVFLENMDSLGGSHVQPVLLKGGPAHEAFLKSIMGKNDSVLQTYYRSLVFSGKGEMPKALPSDADVVAYVAKTKGAIGYVSEGTSTDGVKTLTVK